jgi:hypothetical protein
VRLSPEELSRIRWKGEGSFRALSYYFTVRWNRARFGQYVRFVFEPFAVPPDPGQVRNPPTPGLPPSYSLVDLGTGNDARYVLLYGEDSLVATEDRDAPLRHLFQHVNVESCWQTGDFLLIHAGAVVTPAGDGVLLPGGTGSGKTTLTAGLVRAGFGYLSDETGALDPVSRRLYPHPKTLNIKSGSFDLFPEARARNGKLRPVQGEWYVHADSIRAGAVAGPSQLRFVVAPAYRAGSETSVTPLSRAETIVRLWENVWNLPVYRSRALHLLGEVMAEARGYRLEFGDLGEAVEKVVQLAREAEAQGAGAPPERS